MAVDPQIKIIIPLAGAQLIGVSRFIFDVEAILGGRRTAETGIVGDTLIVLLVGIGLYFVSLSRSWPTSTPKFSLWIGVATSLALTGLSFWSAFR